MTDLRSNTIKLTLLLLLASSSLCAQENNTFSSKIIKQYDSIRTLSPREKVYVHVDRDLFAVQDTLWFKAYLVDAGINSFSKISGLIYFEMIDANGTVVQTMSMPTTMGITWGAFALKQEVYKKGDYTFRAYTNWMQNFKDVYIFKKPIKIIDFLSEESTTGNSKKTSAPPQNSPAATGKPATEIDIQFLPESGALLSDKWQKIAFKAMNDAGKGIKVKGTVTDSKQQNVVNFESNDKGMGILEMLPLAAESYTVNLDGYDMAKKIAFPKVNVTGTYLNVTNSYKADSIKILIYSDLPDQELTLIGQSRGIVCFSAKLKSQKQYKPIWIPKSLFPTGVCQVILQNTKEQNINQRNFFINHQDELKLTVNSAKSTYNIRDSIAISMLAKNAEKQFITGSFSVAVTDDNQSSKDSLNDANIRSYLLLTADLKGEIETPGYYLNNFNEQKHQDLEALMLTQGWVSYNWESTKAPSYKAEKDFEISGRVSNMMNKPGVNAKIILLGNKKFSTVRDTVTNENGLFKFTDFPAMDSTAFVIQAKNSKGKTGTLGIELNEFHRAPFLIPSKRKTLNIDYTTDSIAKQFEKIKNDEYEKGIRSGIALREVKITGKRIIKGSKNLNGDGNADQTITEGDLDKVAKKTLLNVLEADVKGFRRGTHRRSVVPDYFINSDIFKLIIDGVDVDFFYAPFTETIYEHFEYIKGYLDFYKAEDIKGIEVMASKRYSNTYFSEFQKPLDQGEYAYIEVTTRTGEGPFVRHAANMYNYKPQFSYGDNKIFYSPKYTATNKNDSKPDYRSTIYWNPHLLTNENGEASFSFFSADKRGSYTVWIEGSDMNGNFGFKTMKLEIK
ncbi:hypothetical protein [Pedobacter aquatilis]|uniref:hypothetical protein n=1 Tax=Pedobacter aquatilis TaxID=351343 RepID=UPI00292EE98C|nr:hypothetical protein [Pedobacter aquatilis]